MRGLAPKLLAATATLAASLALAAPALAAPQFDGRFKVSSLDSNSKIVQGPDGDMWLTLTSATDDVARITPAGLVTEFDLEGVEKTSGIAVGPEKALWVTTEKGVAKFTTDDPKKAVETPVAAIKEKSSIVAGPDDQMWVATAGNVVHFDPSNPAGAKPIPVAGLKPKDIDVAGSLLVIADQGNKRLLTMTTAGAPKDITLLGTTETSQGVAGGPDGQVAFSKSDKDEGLGLVTPFDTPTAVEMPGDPFGVALGSDGAYWFAMSAATGLERLTTGGQATALPFTGVNPKFFPRQIAAGPGNTLWVTLQNGGDNEYEVARVSGLEPPVAPPAPTPQPAPGPVPPGPAPVVLPETLLGKGPKKVVKTTGRTAEVRFRFSSTTAAATFECSIGKRVKPKGKKARFVGKGFQGCKSPKTYKLPPGRYRFQARAVAGGSRDSSPATFNFKVIRAAPK